MKEADLSAHLYAKHLPGRSYAHILISFDGSEPAHLNDVNMPLCYLLLSALVPFVYTAFFTTVFVPFSAVDVDFVTIKHTNENIFMPAEKSF
jgi:hypothetical protein